MGRHKEDPAGECPTCNERVEKLCLHIRSRHVGVRYGDDVIAALGLSACRKCGAVCSSAAGLRKHWKSSQGCGIQADGADAPATGTNPEDVEPQDGDRQAEPTVQLSMQQKYEEMLFLPGLKAPLTSQAVPVFCETVDKLALAYMADPTEFNLWNILALPKLGMAPNDMQSCFRSFKKRMLSYPDVPYPRRPFHKVADTTKSVQVQSLVNRGRITTASRMLTDDTSLAPQSDETMDALRRLHPLGPDRPFGAADGPSCHTKISLADIADAFSGMRADVAGGICGWNHDLFKTAFRLRSNFAAFFKQFVEQMLQGTLPCQQILTTSALTALNKNPGVRPIAVGELFYRVAAKTILRATFHRHMLLPCQFGVMTPGGVEPIIRLGQSACDGRLPDQYIYGTQLDSTNAFNNLNRSNMAASIRRYAPELFRVAKWAYNQPADLLVRKNGSTVKLKSSQGVRQGDPFGPLFFSLGIRAKIEGLQTYLGTGCIVTAYLDDIQVLSKEPILEKAIALFENTPHDGVQLNPNKCHTTDLSGEATTILGSYIGPDPASFIKPKINKLLEALPKLASVPAQHALLLLRLSLQLKLHHLLRTLPPTPEVLQTWMPLDCGLRQAVLRLRGRMPTEQGNDKILLSLPLRYGGLGIFSHEDCATHAHAASSQASDLQLVKLLDLPRPDEEAPSLSQRTRCAEMYDAQQKLLLENLTLPELRQFADNTGYLARQWLNAIPYNSFTSLSAQDITVGLSYRTLIPGHNTVCRHCASANVLGHDDNCSRREHLYVERHEYIKKIIAYALTTIDGTSVQTEPKLRDADRRSLRTDLKVTGPGSFNAASSEYDVAIISVHANIQARIISNYLPTPPDLKSAQAAVQEALNSKAMQKFDKYAPLVPVPFHPVIISIGGGTLSQSTQTLFAFWSKTMNPTIYKNMTRDLSVSLLRARARPFLV